MRVGMPRCAQQIVVRSRRMLSNRMVGCARGFSYDCARLRATLRPDGVFPLSLRERERGRSFAVMVFCFLSVSRGESLSMSLVVVVVKSSGGERSMTFLCSLLATHTYQNVFFLSYQYTTEKHRIRPSRAGQLESGQTVRQARRRRRLGGPKQSFSRRAGHQAMHHQLETLSNHADYIGHGEMSGRGDVGGGAQRRGGGIRGV